MMVAWCDLKLAVPGRIDHDFAAGHALADIVVGIAVQLQLQALGVPGAEALAGDAGEVQLDQAVSGNPWRRAGARFRRDSRAPIERSMLLMA